MSIHCVVLGDSHYGESDDVVSDAYSLDIIEVLVLVVANSDDGLR